MPGYPPERLRDLLIREEGLRLYPYQDGLGNVTIGVGHNLTAKGLPGDVVASLLADDIAEAEADLDRHLPWWRGVTPNRQLVLAAMCFQLGWPSLSQFHGTLSALAGGLWEDAAVHMLDSAWARQTPARARRMAALVRDG